VRKSFQTVSLRTRLNKAKKKGRSPSVGSSPTRYAALSAALEGASHHEPAYDQRS
jgi:hypothetical protein